MGKYFVDNNQLEKWVIAAEDIEERFGIKKVLGFTSSPWSNGTYCFRR